MRPLQKKAMKRLAKVRRGRWTATVSLPDGGYIEIVESGSGGFMRITGLDSKNNRLVVSVAPPR